MPLRIFYRLRTLLFRHWRMMLLAVGILLSAVALVTYVITRHNTGNKAGHITTRRVHRQPAEDKLTPPTTAPPTVPPLPNALFTPQPTWQQDFTTMANGQPDGGIWNFSTPDTPIHNDEEQIYTARSSNVRIENGKLVFEAHKEAYAGRDYTSARIDTQNHFKIRYGKLEAKIKVPKGSGTWPAFWMLSNDQVYTSRLHPSDADWEQERFYMHDGEIDIMEHAGAYPALVESTTHSFVASDERSTSLPGATDAFHTYGLLWTPNKITFTIDGTPYHEVAKTSGSSQQWPFDQNMYIILNLAMGGEMGGPIDDSGSPWRMEVEHIKYYGYTGP